MFNKKNILVLTLAIVVIIIAGALGSYFFHNQGFEGAGQDLEEEVEEIETEVPEEAEEIEEELDVFEEPPMEETPEDEEESSE